MADISRRHFFFGTLLAGDRSARRLWQRPLAQGAGLSVTQREDEHRRDRRRRPGDERARRTGVGEHRRAGRRGLGARRRRLQALGQGDEVQRLPADARQGAEEHRRGDDRDPRSHARDHRAGRDAARQACLRREAADAHAVGSARPGRRGGEVQGRDADGQPGILARGHAGGGRDHLVGRDRRRDRGPRDPESSELAAGDADASGAGEGPRYARLGSLAGRRRGPSVHFRRRRVPEGVQLRSTGSTCHSTGAGSTTSARA